MIPVIDIACPVRAGLQRSRRADAAIAAAAAGIGFMTVTAFPGSELLSRERRADLLKVFAIPQAEKTKLLRWNFDPTHENVYRGWFPLQSGGASYKEGIDIGPDLCAARRPCATAIRCARRRRCRRTALVPGWREAAAEYYEAMEQVGAALMCSLGSRPRPRPDDLRRGVSQRHLDAQADPLSLARGERPDVPLIDHNGVLRPLIGGAHVDSGLVTLLAQDGVEGLQAQNLRGEWVDVPPSDGTLAVNFGKLLEQWTGGQVRATLHRVVSPARERFSIPFFYEPAVDAEIAPLPLDGVERFEPFLYGDFLWDAATNFVEQRGIRHLRMPRRKTA